MSEATQITCRGGLKFWGWLFRFETIMLLKSFVELQKSFPWEDNDGCENSWDDS